MKKNESSDSDISPNSGRIISAFGSLSQECKLILMIVALALGYNEYLIYLI